MTDADTAQEYAARCQLLADRIRAETRRSSLLWHFLCLEADRVQYYRPWELRSEEEGRIEVQLAETKSQIDKELADFEPSEVVKDEAESANRGEC